MKALTATLEDGSQWFIGLRPDDFNLQAWAERMKPYWPLLQVVTVRAKLVFEDLPDHQLVASVNALFAELHKRATNPFSLFYQDVEIELQPAQAGVAGRLTVISEDQGHVRLAYLSLGLELEVFAEGEEIAFERHWYENDTLQNSDPEGD